MVSTPALSSSIGEHFKSTEHPTYTNHWWCHCTCSYAYSLPIQSSLVELLSYFDEHVLVYTVHPSMYNYVTVCITIPKSTSTTGTAQVPHLFVQYLEADSSLRLKQPILNGSMLELPVPTPIYLHVFERLQQKPLPNHYLFFHFFLSCCKQHILICHWYFIGHLHSPSTRVLYGRASYDPSCNDMKRLLQRISNYAHVKKNTCNRKAHLLRYP